MNARFDFKHMHITVKTTVSFDRDSIRSKSPQGRFMTS